eukprot:XP_001689479.1 acetyltransferase/acyltransferase [Chlamydomonas reinhardtii]
MPPPPPPQVQLIQPTGVARSEDCDKLLVYLPGTDGTGQAILPQIPALRSQGYDTWCLYMPPDDRSDWEQLTTQVTLLLRQLLADWRAGHEQQQQQRQVGADANNSGGEGAAAAPPQRPPPRITIIAESFGCCLALRLAASGAAPELLDRCASAAEPGHLLQPLAVGPVLPHRRLQPSVAVPAGLVQRGADHAAAAAGGRRPGGARQPGAAAIHDPDGAAQLQPELWIRIRIHQRRRGARRRSNDGGGSSSGGGGPATLYYGPAAAANFRTNLLRTGDPGEEALARVRTPVLMVTSARDRLLPSIAEGARLERQLPYCRRHILPDSGHAAMLERGMDITRVMAVAGFLGELPDRPAPAPAVAAAAARRAVPQPAVAGVGGAVEAGGVGAMAAGAGWPGDADSWHMSSGVGSSISGISSSSPAAPSPYTNGNGAPAMPTASFASSSNGASSGSSSSSAVGRGAGRAGAAGAGNGNGNGAGEEGPGASGRDTDSAFDEWCQNLAPWRDLISPVVLGFSNLPPPGSADFERPMLFVGNHQKMGFYDTPLLVYELYVRGYRVRGLAHPGHWAGPFGKWFESFGAVKASPMAAFRLLRGREKVLLFPGGAKEVVKKRGQEYTLLWKDSPDFVRLAAKCDALIVPFAAVGADDAYDVIMDTDEVISHPLLGPLTQGLLARVSSALAPEESIFPITRLPAPVLQVRAARGPTAPGHRHPQPPAGAAAVRRSQGHGHAVYGGAVGGARRGRGEPGGRAAGAVAAPHGARAGGGGGAAALAAALAAVSGGGRAGTYSSASPPRWTSALHTGRPCT